MSLYNELQTKIQNKTAKIGIIGLGYVGLPHAIYYSEQGYPITGIDINHDRITKIKTGKSYIDDIPDTQLQLFAEKNNVTLNYDVIKNLDILFIDVPTPIDEHHQPNMSAIQQVMNQLLKYTKKGQLIILESTTYPSTTQSFIIDPLIKKGYIIGTDIFVGYSPERVDPGNTQFTINNTPKITSGATKNCLNLINTLIGEKARPVSSLEVAELTKLHENTFRFVNINLANELSNICSVLNIDTYEVINAAATKPFGFTPFTPTIKIGGHCIGVDPYYLKWFMEQQNTATPLITAATEIEQSMLSKLTLDVIKILSQHQIPLFNAKIALLGVTYKKDISDTRMSGIDLLIKQLSEYGIFIQLYDNHVNTIKVDNTTYNVHNIDYPEIKQNDLIIITMNHSDVDYKQIKHDNPLIIDTKNVYNSHTI